MTNEPAAHRLTPLAQRHDALLDALDAYAAALNEAITDALADGATARARSLAAFAHLALGSLAASVQQQQQQATERLRRLGAPPEPISSRPGIESDLQIPPSARKIG
ncbi:MAG: hypothetical protein P9E24_08110 [Candidatus Competibacter sp.]|nr:hypothetical protein [Candidatus Competibacter sp.]MDG4583197.1 hypothetical protein [Candidatus Competibacter sp.]